MSCDRGDDTQVLDWRGTLQDDKREATDCSVPEQEALLPQWVCFYIKAIQGYDSWRLMESDKMGVAPRNEGDSKGSQVN